MAAAEQVGEIGIRIRVEGVSWDEITKRMFSDAVMMGWGSSIPNETYYLYRSEGALAEDFYNPEGYGSDVTDGYLDAAMEALTVEEANENWRKVQWDGREGTAMRGACPWVWIVNLDHVTYVRDGLNNCYFSAVRFPGFWIVISMEEIVGVVSGRCLAQTGQCAVPINRDKSSAEIR